MEASSSLLVLWYGGSELLLLLVGEVGRLSWGLPEAHLLRTPLSRQMLSAYLTQDAITLLSDRERPDLCCFWYWFKLPRAWCACLAQSLTMKGVLGGQHAAPSTRLHCAMME